MDAQAPDGSSGGISGSGGADASVVSESGAGGDDGGPSGGNGGGTGAAGGAAGTGGVDGAGRGGAGGIVATGGAGGIVATGGAGGIIATGGAGGIVATGGAGGIIATGGAGGIVATGGRDGSVGPDGGSDRWKGLDTGRGTQLITDPEGVDFGYVELNETSTAVITVFNTGVTPMAPSGSMTGGLFTIESACPPLLDGGETCEYTVRFTPLGPGLALAALDIGDTTVGLSGIGIEPASFTATDRIDLGTVMVGETFPIVVEIVPQATLSRLACVAGGADLTLVSQTCPTSGAVKQPCSFTYSFSATRAGDRTDAVICTGPGGKTTATIVTAVALGRPAMDLQPSSATLTTTLGGTATATFTVTNSGEGMCTDLAVRLTDDSVEFAILANSCAPLLPPLATCEVEVAFSPTSDMPRQGRLAVECASGGPTAYLAGTVAN